MAEAQSVNSSTVTADQGDRGRRRGLGSRVEARSSPPSDPKASPHFAMIGGRLLPFIWATHPY